MRPPLTLLHAELQSQVGVVGLTLFDLRRLGKVDQLSMVGVNGISGA